MAVSIPQKAGPSSAGSGALSLTLPANPAVGNKVVVAVHQNVAVAMTAPSGWTKLHESLRTDEVSTVAIFGRYVAASGDQAPAKTFSLAASGGPIREITAMWEVAGTGTSISPDTVGSDNTTAGGTVWLSGTSGPISKPEGAAFAILGATGSSGGQAVDSAYPTGAFTMDAVGVRSFALSRVFTDSTLSPKSTSAKSVTWRRPNGLVIVFVDPASTSGGGGEPPPEPPPPPAASTGLLWSDMASGAFTSLSNAVTPSTLAIRLQPSASVGEPLVFSGQVITSAGAIDTGEAFGTPLVYAKTTIQESPGVYLTSASSVTDTLPAPPAQDDLLLAVVVSPTSSTNATSGWTTLISAAHPVSGHYLHVFWRRVSNTSSYGTGYDDSYESDIDLSQSFTYNAGSAGYIGVKLYQERGTSNPVAAPFTANNATAITAGPVTTTAGRTAIRYAFAANAGLTTPTVSSGAIDEIHARGFNSITDYVLPGTINTTGFWTTSRNMAAVAISLPVAISQIDLPRIESTLTVYAPTLTTVGGITLGRIESTATVYPPQLTSIVGATGGVATSGVGFIPI